MMFVPYKKSGELLCFCQKCLEERNLLIQAKRGKVVKFLGGSFLDILCRNSLFELVFSLLVVGQASFFQLLTAGP